MRAFPRMRLFVCPISFLPAEILTHARKGDQYIMNYRFGTLRTDFRENYKFFPFKKFIFKTKRNYE